MLLLFYYYHSYYCYCQSNNHNHSKRQSSHLRARCALCGANARLSERRTIRGRHRMPHIIQNEITRHPSHVTCILRKRTLNHQPHPPPSPPVQSSAHRVRCNWKGGGEGGGIGGESWPSCKREGKHLYRRLLACAAAAAAAAPAASCSHRAGGRRRCRRRRGRRRCAGRMSGWG